MQWSYFGLGADECPDRPETPVQVGTPDLAPKHC